jgi:multidrug efflux pump subunit AcrA (membrane-fusion protein)
VLRAQAMVSSEIGSEVDLEILEDLRDLERARGVTYRRLGVGIKVALKAAINRRLAVTSSFALLPAPNPTPPRTDERLAGLAEALVVQQKRIEELTIQREAYDLRASMPGQITALHIAPGGFLSAGSPILTITNPEPSSIAVWVSEDYRDVPSQGSLLRVSNGVATADCIVLAVSSRVEMIPSRLWKASDIEEYGRVFSVSPAPSLELRPGERVRLEVADQSDLD